MSTFRRDRLYWVLVAVLAILGAVAVYLPGAAPGAPPAGELPAPRPIIALASFLGLAVVYGGLGYVGLRASRAVGFPEPLDPRVPDARRYLVPALAGVALGVFFIGADAVFAGFNGIGRLPHPPFPTSIAASITAAIGEEILFRLLLVGGGYWLLRQLVTGAAAREGAFWAVALFSAMAFTAAHLPGILFILGNGDPASATLPPVLLLELFLLNGALSLLAAEFLRRYGLLAAMGVHFWVDIVWHVIGGGLQ